VRPSVSAGIATRRVANCFYHEEKFRFNRNGHLAGMRLVGNDVVSRLSSEELGSSKLGTGGTSFENVGKVVSRSFDNLEDAQ
jgi:hypothetical protein